MPTVMMYTLSTCPWCNRAKKYFTERNIPFTYTDYDLSDADTKRRITEEMDSAGVTGFPYVRIGDTIVSGYKPDTYARLLGLEH